MIIITYRRNDCAFVAAVLHSRLVNAFNSTDMVFMDTTSIPLGSPFTDEIEQAVSNCEVMLVLIGDRWLQPRLKNPKDLVRLEIEKAFTSNKRVIPVLVGNVSMPTRNKLPVVIRGLCDLQYFRIRADGLFRYLDDLQDELHSILGGPRRTILKGANSPIPFVLDNLILQMERMLGVYVPPPSDLRYYELTSVFWRVRSVEELPDDVKALLEMGDEGMRTLDDRTEAFLREQPQKPKGRFLKFRQKLAPYLAILIMYGIPTVIGILLYKYLRVEM